MFLLSPIVVEWDLGVVVERGVVVQHSCSKNKFYWLLKDSYALRSPNVEGE